MTIKRVNVNGDERKLYKCDRCGHQTLVVVGYPADSWGLAKLSVKCQPDLCPECSRKFIDWVQELSVS